VRGSTSFPTLSACTEQWRTHCWQLRCPLLVVTHSVALWLPRAIFRLLLLVEHCYTTTGVAVSRELVHASASSMTLRTWHPEPSLSALLSWLFCPINACTILSVVPLISQLVAASGIPAGATHLLCAVWYEH